MAKKRNPVIEKAYEEGKKKGIEIGSKIGFEQGKYSACCYFAKKFDGLDKVPGVGPVLSKRIIELFGKEFFDDQEKKNSKT